jgi:hypothetical protein
VAIHLRADKPEVTTLPDNMRQGSLACLIDFIKNGLPGACDVMVSQYVN